MGGGFGFLTWSLHLCAVLGNLGGAWALEIDYWVCVWHVTIGMEPGLQSCAWLRISDKPPDTLLHFCVCEWSLPCNFFFLFFFQLIMQPLCFSPGLPASRYRLVFGVFIFLCSKDLRDSPFNLIFFLLYVKCPYLNWKNTIIHTLLVEGSMVAQCHKTFLKQVYTGSHVPPLMLASSFMSAPLHGERAGFSIPAEPRGYMVWGVLRWW